MKVLVIGGTRFIGPYVVRALIQAGQEVAVFHRGQTRAGLPGSVRVLLGDRREISQHRDAFLRFAPDVVLDMIAYTEADTRSTQEAFSDIARRLVVVSSGDVYLAYDRLRGAVAGSLIPTPIKEDGLLRERLFPYRDKSKGPDDLFFSYDKIPVERAAMTHPTLAGTILRLPAMYGPGDYQHRLFEFLKRMDDGRTAILLGQARATWRWSYGYVENVAAAIALAIADGRAAGRIYNVGEPPVMQRELVEAIGQAAGWGGRIVSLPDEQLPQHLKTPMNFAQDLTLDTERIRTELGYREVVSFQDAVQRTVAWERANPLEEIDPSAFNYMAEDEILRTLPSHRNAMKQ